MIDYTEFNALIFKMWNVYEQKNADYGDSFANSLRRFGRVAFVVRANDKMERLISLAHKENQVADESFDDTCFDLALYCIMYLLEKEGLIPDERVD